VSRRLAIPRPSDFGTVGGWWTADDRTMLLSSGHIQQWPDRSGNGRDLFGQGGSSTWPTKVGSVVNGNGVARFAAASSQFLQTTSFSTLGTTITTWWAVAKWASQSPAGLTLFSGQGGTGNLVYCNTTTTLAMNGGSTQFGTTLDVTTAFRSYVFVFNGASSSMRANGAQLATGNDASAALTDILIGQYGSGGFFFDGDVSDIGFFLGVPTALTDFEQIYLRRGWRTW
jgi:hypothetical protein